jgi:beta-glucosidase/6-phospho-beta-glucosidase/beta-galactosidase
MNPFNSFFWGGFECADHINRSGERINLLEKTRHDSRVKQDYRLLKQVGILTVREGICWSNVEKSPYAYDFSEVQVRIEAGLELGIQQVWDICHFGYPDGLIPTHPKFTDRFVSMCLAFVQFYRKFSDQEMYLVPINEISFLSWHSGDVRGTVPFAINAGFDIKYHLCKAAIQGIIAVKNVDPNCRILLVEPLIYVHPLHDHPDDDLWQINEAQYQAMDIIFGRLHPELGGSHRLVDFLGFNYYWSCQWEHGGNTLPWPAPESGNRRVPLSSLLKNVYQRYGLPVIVTETGHFNEGRPRWIHEIKEESEKALEMGIDLRGVCIYPVIERPDWDDLNQSHKSGIWDLDEYKNRIPHQESLDMLEMSIASIDKLNQSFRKKPSDLGRIFRQFLD